MFLATMRACSLKCGSLKTPARNISGPERDQKKYDGSRIWLFLNAMIHLGRLSGCASVFSTNSSRLISVGSLKIR